MTIEIMIKTTLGSRVQISSYDDGGCWMTNSMDDERMNTSLTAKELDQLIKGLQAIQEVTE